MRAILSKGNTNAKTAKNSRKTLILYLKPGEVLGRNICPKASEGCLSACLNTAGRGAFSNVQDARYKRTVQFIQNRTEFLAQCAKEINKEASKTKELAVRLNGTSDLKLAEMLVSQNVISENVVFYDYTKIKQKAGRKLLQSGHKYVVTFSRSESNENEAIEVLNSGNPVAAVFNDLPTEWNGYKVIDGDKADDLMLDYEGAFVLGLKAKGKARKDTSGFVIK